MHQVTPLLSWVVGIQAACDISFQLGEQPTGSSSLRWVQSPLCYHTGVPLPDTQARPQLPSAEKGQEVAMTSGDQTDFPGPQIKVTGDALTHSTDLPSTQADWGSRQKEEPSQESGTWLESCPPPSQASHGLTSGPLHMSLPGSDIPSPIRSLAEMALLPGSPPRPPRQGPTAAPQKQQGLASLPKCSTPHFLSAIPTLMPGVTTGSRPWEALLASSGPF